MTDDEDRRSRAHSRRSHRSHRSRSRSRADASDADSGDAKPRISRRERDAMAERRRSMADEVLGLGPEAPAPSLSRRSSRRMRDEPEPAFFDAEPPSAEMERRGRSADRRGRSAERRGRSSDRRGRSSDRRERSSDRRERSAERRGRSRERRDRSREPARDMAADRAKEHAVQRFRPDSLAEAQEPREKIRDVPREPREASGRRREPERRREANGDAAVAAAVPPSMADPGRKAGRPASIMSRRSLFSSFSKLSAMSESSNINAEEVQRRAREKQAKHEARLAKQRERDQQRLDSQRTREEQRAEAQRLKDEERLSEARRKEESIAAKQVSKEKAKIEAERKREAAEREKQEKRELKERLAEEKRNARELAEQQKTDLRERRQQEKEERKREEERKKEAETAAFLAEVHEQERARELREIQRKQQRLTSLTPFRRRENAAERVLTPHRRHVIIKSLVMMQMHAEFLQLAQPGSLTQYGYPFAAEFNGSSRRHLPLIGRKKDLLPVGASTGPAPDGSQPLQEPLVLRHMFHVHLHTLPGLDTAPLSFWQRRVQPLYEEFAQCDLSTSEERDELVLTHLLSLIGTQYLGLIFTRGVGVRGPGELRGPGAGEPGTDAWGAGKQWGAGTVKRGLDRPYTLTDEDLRMVDSLFPSGSQRTLWTDAGREAGRIQDDWEAFKEQLVEKETGLEETISWLNVSSVHNLPDYYQNTEQWVRIHVAVVMRWLLVKSPSADSLFTFLRTVHMLFPYWPARQLLRMANAKHMIQALLSLILAHPPGGKSLLQVMVNAAITRDASRIQSEYVQPLTRELNEPALVHKVEAYVRHRHPAETQRIHREMRRTGDDILTTILLAPSEPRIDSAMQGHVRELQRCFAASPYRTNISLAYPTTTPAGAERGTSEVAWPGATPQDIGKARKFAQLKLLLRELLKKRDREKFGKLLDSSLLVDFVKDTLQNVFYEPIRQIAQVADLSDRLGDVQQLIEDAIKTRRTTQNTIEDWVAIADRHHEFIYYFVHEIAPIAQPIWRYCQNALDYMALSTTDPQHPGDRTAENIEMNLDEMLQDERLSNEDVDDILAEADQLVAWSRWSKIRRELEQRQLFLLAHNPAPSGLSRDSVPEDMRAAVKDIDALMLRLMKQEGAPIDDGVCNDVRGFERSQVPWAFFDKDDPLGQGIPAEPPSDLHRVEPYKGMKPPTVDAIRKLMPMFRELMVLKLPDWLDPQVSGAPDPSGEMLVKMSKQLLKKSNRRGQANSDILSETLA